MRDTSKLIGGIGLNDDSTPATKKGQRGNRIYNPYYSAWKNMLSRCYDNKTMERYPTYIQCTVDPDWHYLSVFKEWMEQQDWHGKHLDKDIIVLGNKHYAPDLCCFVTQQVNHLLCDSALIRGPCPQGVSFFKANRNFVASISINGKSHHLGCHPTAEAAEKAYRRAKAALITTYAIKEKDSRIADGLARHAEKFR